MIPIVEFSTSSWSHDVAECRFHKEIWKPTLGTFFPNYLCYLYSMHSIENTQAQHKKNLAQRCVPFLEWEPLLIQVRKPPLINGVETPHQPSSHNMIRISIKKPLHQQQGTRSITELRLVALLLWRTIYIKSAYHASQQNNQILKRTKEIELLASTTFHDA